MMTNSRIKEKLMAKKQSSSCDSAGVHLLFCCDCLVCCICHSFGSIYNKIAKEPQDTFDCGALWQQYHHNKEIANLPSGPRYQSFDDESDNDEADDSSKHSNPLSRSSSRTISQSEKVEAEISHNPLWNTFS